MDKSQFNEKTARQDCEAVEKTGNPASIRSDPVKYLDELTDTKGATQLMKGVLPNKLYYHCKRGHLPHIWQNGKLFFSQAVLVEWHPMLKRSKRYQAKVESDGNNQGIGLRPL